MILQKLIETLVFLSTRYAGRPVSASPATGNKKTHQRELKNLLEDSLTVAQ